VLNIYLYLFKHIHLIQMKVFFVFVFCFGTILTVKKYCWFNLKKISNLVALKF